MEKMWDDPHICSSEGWRGQWHLFSDSQSLRVDGCLQGWVNTPCRLQGPMLSEPYRDSLDRRETSRQAEEVLILAVATVESGGVWLRD